MIYKIAWPLAAMMLLGCAGHPPQRPAHPASARESAGPVVVPSSRGAIIAGSPASAPEGAEIVVRDKLSLVAALALTVQHNPTLAAFAAEIEARDGAARQSGLPANPSLDLEVENFAGRGERQGMDGAETTLALSQLIELGGKRHQRQQLTLLEKDLAGWDYQSKKLDLLTATAQAFIQVLAAQEQASLNEELVRVAGRTQAAVFRRVEAGKVSPVQKIRAQIELAAARSEAGRSQRQWAQARHRLAAFWGGDGNGFTELTGDLTHLTPPAGWEKDPAQLEKNPDLGRWPSELARRQAALALARSRATPDATFSLGVRNFQETADNALVAGISIPLPLFDRNQGAISEAGANLTKALQQQQAAHRGLQAQLAMARQELAAAYSEAVTLRDEIMPGAQQLFGAMEVGYQEGKLDFLEMLEAQKTLFTVRRHYGQALRAYHLARLDVERLQGLPVAIAEKNN